MAEKVGGRPERKGGGGYHKVQKSVMTKNYEERNRGEEIVITGEKEQ